MQLQCQKDPSISVEVILKNLKAYECAKLALDKLSAYSTSITFMNRNTTLNEIISQTD